MKETEVIQYGHPRYGVRYVCAHCGGIIVDQWAQKNKLGYSVPSKCRFCKSWITDIRRGELSDYAEEIYE